MDARYLRFFIIKVFWDKVNVETKNRQAGDCRRSGNSPPAKVFPQSKKASRLSKTPGAGSFFVIWRGERLFVFFAERLFLLDILEAVEHNRHQNDDAGEHELQVCVDAQRRQ